MNKALCIAILAFTLCFVLYGCSQNNDGSADYAIGTITIVSGGQAYTPLENWIFSYEQNGLAADGARKQPQEVWDELITIPYENDFQIIIDGELLGEAGYTLFNEKFEEYYRQPNFVAPQNNGEYILFVELAWGNEENYSGYQYCFKLAVETIIPESVKENIRIDGVIPSWMPDGEHISYYKNQKMVITDKMGNTVDEIPLNNIMDESVISFMYSFSPDGRFLATANGIVNREGKVISDGFPSNGVDRKSQGLMLDAIGWMNADTAYIVDRLGITIYSVSTDTYRDATPGLADSFNQYLRKDQTYLNAVLIYFTYDTMYKIWQQDSQLFYVGRREFGDRSVAEDIFTLTLDGERGIAQGDRRDTGYSSYILWVDGQYVIYSLAPGEIVFYDYHTDDTKKQVVLDVGNELIQKGWYRDQTLYIGYPIDPSPESGFTVESIPLVGERTKFTPYTPGDTKLDVLIAQTDQVTGFSLVAANDDTLFYSFEHSTIENDESKWQNALIAYDISTEESRVLFDGESGWDYRSVYRVSPDGDTALAVCTPLDSSKEYFTIIPLV